MQLMALHKDPISPNAIVRPTQECCAYCAYIQIHKISTQD